MDPSQVSFSFRVDPHTDSLCYVSLSVMMFALRFPCGCYVHQWGSTIWVCDTTTLWSIHLADICTSQRWSMAHARSAVNGYSLHCFEKVGFMLLIQLSPSHSILYCRACSFVGLAESGLIPLPCLNCGEGSSFPGSAPPSDMFSMLILFLILLD